MTSTKEGQELLTAGQAAKLLGLDVWMVQVLFRRGLVPEPARLGPFRAVPRSMLPQIEAAARQAGYLGGQP